MKIGSMRHVITIQTLVETTDEYGERVQSWLDTSTCRAAIRTPTGKDKVNADQLKVQLDRVVTIRFRRDVDRTSQIIFDGRVFRITYIDNLNERDREMDLYCVEQIEAAT